MRAVSGCTGLGLIAVAFALSACGSDDKSDTTGTAGVAATLAGAATGSALSLKDLPAFAKVYPGAKVITNLKMKSADQLAGTLSYSSAAGRDQLIEFYKKSLADNGLEISAEADSGGSYMINGTNAEKGQQLNVTIFPSGEDASNMVTIVHSIPNPETPKDAQ